MPTYKSKLNEMVSRFPTDYWNDSCAYKELSFAIEHGAVGATTNPTIVATVLKTEFSEWETRIRDLIAEHPSWSEVDLSWKVIEEMAVRGASLLHPAFERHSGRKGRLSIQTNPQLYRNAQAISEHAIHFDSLAPNMQVKCPVTQAGIKAIEESTARGVSINATVSFSVPQAIAVAEAVERGLARREAEGSSIERMAPVCTIMIGRVDDWLKVIQKRDGIDIDPAYLDWAGIACMKKAYEIYQEKGYRLRLLVAAYRHLGHWAELVGGDIVQSIPFEWQQKINASDIEVRDRFSEPVDPKIVAELYAKFPDFRRCYDEGGMAVTDFDDFGATVRTLRGFITSYHEVETIIREIMLPNPDLKSLP